VKPWVNERKQIKPRMGRKRFDLVGFLPCLRRWGNHLPMLVRKSFSSRAKARSKASWFFRFEKSGM
jgi:hypothetical protein